MGIEDVRKLAVVGAGQMGAQIAMQAALHGVPVALHDVSEEQLERGMKSNRQQLMRRVEKGRMDTATMGDAFERVDATTDLARAVGEADFVIEAVVEELEVKRRVFAELDRLAPPHAILATNSSYIGNSELADATGRPDKVVNMHFFYPPLVMRLVEVVKGERTSDETVVTTAELARRIGKEAAVLRKELPGFLVNRILRAITNEAYFLLEEGVASFADIDRACELGLNHPMGPFKLSDFSGLDIGYNARREAWERSGDDRDRPSPALARRVERGDLGRKTGRGFYDYSTDPPTPTPD